MYKKFLVPSIMQELDRLPNHVTLVAATNRLDMVDEALMRRFSIKHEIKNMKTVELNEMIEQYLKATDTQKYVSENTLSELTTTYQNPGQIMPELIRTIGKNIFEEKKDEITAQVKTEDGEKLDLFEVTYTWKQTISAQTEEDAIAIARNNRTHYHNISGATTNYEAKRAEFISPQGEKR